MLFLVIWIGLAIPFLLIRRRIVDRYLAAVQSPALHARGFTLDPTADWWRSNEVMRTLHERRTEPQLEAMRRRALAVCLLFPVIAVAMIFPAVWAATLLYGI